MNIRKVVSLVLVLLALCMTVAGCAKVVDIKEEVVQVQIVDAYYRAPYVTMIRAGKTLVPINHSATYRITVKYEGVEYNITNRVVYFQYNAKIGEYVDAGVKTKTLDNGNMIRDILWLGAPAS